MPILHVLAGPNGAGKSTLATRVLVPTTRLPFVDADVIAADRWPGEELDRAYEASAAAAEERERLLAARRSFVTETVFSHPSKSALVRGASQQGYLVHLHVVMVPLEASLQRVAFRSRRGGHTVPEQKIRDRYERLWDLVTASAQIVDRTTFYDNASARHPFRVVAHLEHGTAIQQSVWPQWAPPVLRTLG